MSKYQDQNYLLAEQYRDDTNLQARIFLHRQFSTNKYSWFRWVFDHFTVPEESEILELGCGPGDLWVENIDRIPGSWQIVLSDFSAGMSRKAIGNLGGLSEKFQFRVIDAQAIPYPGEQFEAVIANFMLYHVPERGRALSEIQRVLKRGGRLYAATVGEKHMQELFDLVARFDASLVADHQAEKNGFTLESGYSQLIRWFGKVTGLTQLSG
jgi:ubiquinone/menaquinone biosynthesis C-methylase UbiE